MAKRQISGRVDFDAWMAIKHHEELKKSGRRTMMEILNALLVKEANRLELLKRKGE